MDQKDPIEKQFHASKHCTAAWHGQLNHFTSLRDDSELIESGFFMMDPTDETKGKQALVYDTERKRYTLVNIAEIAPPHPDMSLEPLWYAVANGEHRIVQFFVDKAKNPKNLAGQTLGLFKQIITVRPDIKPAPGAGTAPVTRAAPATAPPPNTLSGFKYVIVTSGPASKSVTPADVAIVNEHRRVANLLVPDRDPTCNRSCQESDCVIS